LTASSPKPSTVYSKTARAMLCAPQAKSSKMRTDTRRPS
jgi:hypothetical protein